MMVKELLALFMKDGCCIRATHFDAMCFFASPYLIDVLLLYIIADYLQGLMLFSLWVF